MSQQALKPNQVLLRNLIQLRFYNQLREKEVGVMFGNPETTTGGRTLKFYRCRPRCRDVSKKCP